MEFVNWDDEITKIWKNKDVPVTTNQVRILRAKDGFKEKNGDRMNLSWKNGGFSSKSMRIVNDGRKTCNIGIDILGIYYWPELGLTWQVGNFTSMGIIWQNRSKQYFSGSFGMHETGWLSTCALCCIRFIFWTHPSHHLESAHNKGQPHRNYRFRMLAGQFSPISQSFWDISKTNPRRFPAKEPPQPQRPVDPCRRS